MTVHTTAFQNQAEYWDALSAWAEALAGQDPSAAQLWDAISARTCLSARQQIFLPLPYVQAAFHLRPCQAQALALLILDGYTNAFCDRTLSELTELLTLAGEDGGSVREQLTDRSPGWALCLEEVPEFGEHLLVPNPRILNFALDCHLSEPQVPGLVLEQPSDSPIPERLQSLSSKIALQLQTAGSNRMTFLLLGQEGSGRRTLARSLAGQLGTSLLIADGEGLTRQNAAEFRQAIHREAILQCCPVLLTHMEPVMEEAAADLTLARALTELLAQLAEPSGFSLIAGEEDWLPAAPPEDWLLFPVSLPPLSLHESEDLWDRLLEHREQEGTVSGRYLASKYRLTPGQIKRAIRDGTALAGWENCPGLTAELLDRACRRQLHHRLGDKARRVETVFTWDELILPETAKKLLRSACDQVRYRTQVYDSWGFGQKLSYGGGLSLLFSGPPGTGKTMAAQVAAGELGLELYKVELPAIVSKYVGETEKNLRDIFREATRSQAILFFDEADVLFAKRTELKDAQDKYSNMEAAYLLQKMEEYPGISILATNFLQNFDEAFKRRLKFIIDFPFPDAEYRLKLWQSVFPAKTPLDPDVDFDFLAQQFELSGSSIKNTAVNAAFLAAGDEAPVGMSHLLTALRRELQKSGKSLSRQDFGPYYMLVEEESHGSV